MNFCIGNVIQHETSYGTKLIVIVTKVSKDTISWVSFDMTNVSGISRIEDYEEDKECFCIGSPHSHFDIESDYCEECENTGYVKKTVKGLKNSKLLGLNVKDYILKSLLKNFEL